MPFDKILFAAILALCAAVALTALLPAAGAGGGEHPEHPAMRHGEAPAPAERDVMLAVGWLFGVAVILTFVALIAFGARSHLRDLGRWLALAAAAAIAAWTSLVVAYRGYLDDPAPALYLALPAPTAIMVYLLWPAGMAFVLFFVFGFRRWVLPEEDLEVYRRLLDAVRERRPEDGGPAPGAGA